MPTFTYTFERVEGGTRFTRHGDIRVRGIMRLNRAGDEGHRPQHMQGLLEKLKLVLEEDR